AGSRFLVPGLFGGGRRLRQGRSDQRQTEQANQSTHNETPRKLGSNVGADITSVTRFPTADYGRTPFLNGSIQSVTIGEGCVVDRTYRSYKTYRSYQSPLGASACVLV